MRKAAWFLFLSAFMLLAVYVQGQHTWGANTPHNAIQGAIGLFFVLGGIFWYSGRRVR